MPFESAKQARLMRAVAHGWHKPGGGGPSAAVAKDFVSADKAHPSGYAGGGSVNKGYKGHVESYAAGGPVLGRTRDFIKERDGEDQHMNEQYAPYKNPDMKSQEYEKGKSEANPKPKDKSLKAIKPRG